MTAGGGPGFSLRATAAGPELRLDDAADHPLRSWCHRDGAVAVVVGRLLYRRKVLSTLRRRRPDAPMPGETSSDAELVLAVYQDGGPAALRRLEGDFAAAVWDDQTRRLVACSDLLGAVPLYWTSSGATAAVGTGPRALVDLLPDRSLSFEFVAQFLATGGTVMAGASSPGVYEGVFRAPPGAGFSLAAGERSPRSVYQRRWDDEIVAPGRANVDELAGEFRERLGTAVRERLSGTAAAHLSGGMDSTSVCLLALGHVRSGSAGGPLHAISLGFESLPTLAGDRPYLDEVTERERRGGDLVVHRLPADGIAHYDTFAAPPLHEEPYRGLWATSTERAMLAAAAGAGVTSVVSGHGADEILAVHPHHLAGLLRQGRLLAAWKEACRWAEAHQSHPWGFLHGFGIAPLGLDARWARLTATRRRPPPETASSALLQAGPPSWIDPAFIRRYDLAARARTATARHGGRPPQLAAGLAAVERRAGDLARWILATPGGIAVGHPFLDPHVAGFALGALTVLEPQPGAAKPLLAEAMRGVLPEAIRTRRDKRPFDELYYLGLRRHRRRLEELVRRSPVADLGIFDQDRLVAALDDAALGVAHARRCQALNWTLSFLCWITHESDPRAATVPPVVVSGS